MPTFEWILLPVMPLLLAGSIICSATETALFSLTQADRLRLRRQHPRAHHAVASLLANPRGLLIAILLANVAINTGYFAVSAVVSTTLVGVWAIVFSVAALLVLIIAGEVVPKTLAAAHRVAICRLVAPIALVGYGVVSPVRALAESIVITPLSRLFRSDHEGGPHGGAITADELGALLEAGGRQGVIREDEERLLAGVLSLGAMRIRDVMTPRVDLAWIDAAATSADLLAKAQQTGHSKFPVAKGRLDAGQIVGVVSLQRALPTLNRGQVAPVQSLMEPPRYVPERARLDKLLEHFRATRTDVALCVSESGDLTGWVEIDDVIREVIALATPAGEEAQDQVRMIALGLWEVPGRLNIRDWADLFDIPAAERATHGRVSTLGGLIVSKLGRVPTVGDELSFRHLRLRVEAVRGRTVDRASVAVVADASSLQTSEPRP